MMAPNQPKDIEISVNPYTTFRIASEPRLARTPMGDSELCTILA